LTSGEFQPDPDFDAEFFLLATERLEAGGLHAYEVSNYARPGRESIHNQAYWEGADYLGLGPGAVSTVAGRRWRNRPHTALYTQLAGAGTALETDVEELTQEQRRTERLALLLRTRRGIDRQWLVGQESGMAELVRAGLARQVEDRLVLTARGRLVADGAALHLLG
jgi:oxygen-independent coproporphyrinogen-3 oxidase